MRSSPRLLSLVAFGAIIWVVPRFAMLGAVTAQARTLGKKVIPYRFKLMPGMFSHGVALIRAVDSARYAFLTERSDIVATLGGFQGDTTGFQFGLKNEYAEESNPAYTGYGRFWFSGGVQFAQLFFRADPERPREVKSDVVLLDSLGRFRPIERLMLAKLPPGCRRAAALRVSLASRTGSSSISSPARASMPRPALPSSTTTHSASRTSTATSFCHRGTRG